MTDLTLYVVETTLLASRLEQWLRNTGDSENHPYHIFTTLGPLLIADLNPMRKALEDETLIFPRLMTMVPGGNSEVRKRLSELESFSKKASQIFWLSFPSSESELSFRTCINFLKVGEKSKRVVLSSVTARAFRFAFTKPATNHELKNFYNAAFTRVVADAWFGMNVSFFIAGFASAGRPQVAAGRLQWPVLKLIFKLVNQQGTTGPIALSDQSGKHYHFYNAPDSWLSAGTKLKVESVQFTKSGNNLYTAQSLIPELLTLFNINHQTAVKHLHLLFEQGCITWPWTAVSWLPASYKEFMDGHLALLSAHLQMEAPQQGANLNTSIYCLHPSAKQHGILAIKPPQPEYLQKVYDLIVAKCLAVHDSNQRQCLVSFSGMDPAKDRKNFVYIALTSGDPDLNQGDKIIFQPSKIVFKNSIGRAEILDAMANVGPLIGQQKLWQQEHEQFGLGRAANRNNILDSLLRNKYILEDTSGIRLSDAGLNLLSQLENSNLFDIEKAYNWEDKLRKIESGKLHPDVFLDEWQQFLIAEIESVKDVEISKSPGLSGGGGYRNKASIWKAIRQLPCPCCKEKGLKVDQYGIVHDACVWNLSAIQFGRRISWNQLYILLLTGSTHTLKKNANKTKDSNLQEAAYLKGRLTLNLGGEVHFQPVD